MTENYLLNTQQVLISFLICLERIEETRLQIFNKSLDIVLQRILRVTLTFVVFKVDLEALLVEYRHIPEQCSFVVEVKISVYGLALLSLNLFQVVQSVLRGIAASLLYYLPCIS